MADEATRKWAIEAIMASTGPVRVSELYDLADIVITQADKLCQWVDGASVVVTAAEEGEAKEAAE